MSTLDNTPPMAPAGEAAQMTLMDHLIELRQRLLYAVIGVMLGTGVGMFLVFGSPQIVDIIIEAFTPAGDPQPLSAVGTAETFTSYMSVAIWVGIILAMPLVVYQLIAFVSPALHKHEQRAVFLTLPFITLFFLTGIAFGWFVTVPAAIRFLLGFSSSELIEIKPAISDFLRTVTLLLLINGVVFEMPMVIYLLARLELVTVQQLSRYRRYAMVAVVIVAAIVTPTQDPINLLLLALPMYLLYELGIILARFAPRLKKPEPPPSA